MAVAVGQIGGRSGKGRSSKALTNVVNLGQKLGLAMARKNSVRLVDGLVKFGNEMSVNLSAFRIPMDLCPFLFAPLLFPQTANLNVPNIAALSRSQPNPPTLPSRTDQNPPARLAARVSEPCEGAALRLVEGPPDPSEGPPGEHCPFALLAPWLHAQAGFCTPKPVNTKPVAWLGRGLKRGCPQCPSNSTCRKDNRKQHRKQQKETKFEKALITNPSQESRENG